MAAVPSSEDAAATPPPQRFFGELTQWSAARGFGFIKPDDLGPNVFLHRSSIVSHSCDQIEDGIRLEFERRVEQGKTDRAENVSVLLSHTQRQGGPTHAFVAEYSSHNSAAPTVSGSARCGHAGLDAPTRDGKAKATFLPRVVARGRAVARRERSQQHERERERNGVETLTQPGRGPACGPPGGGRAARGTSEGAATATPNAESTHKRARRVPPEASVLGI
jgi:CspA family cold shock protein